MDALDRYAGRDIYDDGDYKRKVCQIKKTNHLLVYPQLGRVKPTTYNLPGSDFVYGYKEQTEEEGTAQVVGSWKSHKAAPEALEGRDFVRLNKYAAMNGCTSAKNVAAYRRANDIRVGQGSISGNGSYNNNNPVPYFPNSDTIFGRPSPACVPIADVLNNSYQRKWIGEQRNIRSADKQQRRHMKYAQAQHTRASLGHTKVQAPQNNQAPFKLRQFANVASRVRTEGYRNQLFSNTTGGTRSYLPMPEDNEADYGPENGVGFGPVVQF